MLERERCSVLSDSFVTPWTYSPWNSPGHSSLFFLQEIFPTQKSNPVLPHCGQILYQLSHSVELNFPKASFLLLSARAFFSLCALEGSRTVIFHLPCCWNLRFERSLSFFFFYTKSSKSSVYFTLTIQRLLRYYTTNAFQCFYLLCTFCPLL